MPVRYLSDPELARLNGWPDEIAAEDAVAYFTLSRDDMAWLAGFNRAENRVGVAVQLSTLCRGWAGSRTTWPRVRLLHWSGSLPPTRSTRTPRWSC